METGKDRNSPEMDNGATIDLNKIWQIAIGEQVYQADLDTLKQWIAEGRVMPNVKVRKGNFNWIEAGRAPALRPVFSGEERPQPRVQSAPFYYQPEVKIRVESLPMRCETCHQSDCFNPQTNYCGRCSGVLAAAENQNMAAEPERKRPGSGSITRLPIVIQLVFIAAVTYAFFFIFRIVQETGNVTLRRGDGDLDASDVWSTGYTALGLMAVVFGYVFIRAIWLMLKPKNEQMPAAQSADNSNRDKYTWRS